MDKARVLLLAAVLTASGCDAATDGPVREHPYSEAAFNRWVSAAPSRDAGYERFERFLADHGVADVVPAWQLLRTDAKYAARCGIVAFQLPAEEKWPSIVPTLRLVREHVIPVVGPVEVVASDRDDRLNDCANGASRSRHLAFAAVDLVAPGRADKRQLFEDLCAMHQRAGAKSGMGLGAYFDPYKPLASAQGRFHIDQSGFRTWGFGYTRASSYCVTMREA